MRLEKLKLKLGTYEALQKRLQIERDSNLCVANSLIWVIEELIRNPEVCDRINFQKILDFRTAQLKPDSILNRQLRDIRAIEPFSGKVLRISKEAEDEVIDLALKEVRSATGINLVCGREHYSPQNVDKLVHFGTLPNMRYILLTSCHAEPLFPQPSWQVLVSKLRDGEELEPYGGNTVFLKVENN